MIKLSIVIPVYNVEAYISKCIESCLNQDIELHSYEIILINDGSKDGSLQICETYEKAYKNIKVYSQQNAGLSEARNAGIKKSIGKYIWFIDSDDWILEDCLSELLVKTESQNLDMLGVTSLEVLCGKTYQRFNYNEEAKNVFYGKDYLMRYKTSCACFYIFKRDFLIKSELIFLKGVYHEDEEFTPRALYLAEHIGFLNKTLYYYDTNQRPGSITNSVNPKKSFDLLTVSESLSCFLNTAVAEEKCKQAFHDRISLCLNNALFNTRSIDKKSSSDLNLAFYSKKHLTIHLRKSTKLKYKFEGFLFLLFPKNTVMIYKWLKKLI